MRIFSKFCEKTREFLEILPPKTGIGGQIAQTFACVAILFTSQLAPLALSLSLTGGFPTLLPPSFSTPLPLALAQAAAEQAALEELSDEEIAALVKKSPEQLGSLSVGHANNGRLLNGLAAEESEYLELVAPDAAYGTQETLEYLHAALKKVHEEFPDSPALYLGHISKPKGGYLSPHKSHQSGRDLDISFFYQGEGAWYKKGTWKNLDVERTWAFMRALITETDVEMILLDRWLQKLVKQHATQIGEDKIWLNQVFNGQGGRGPIVRHAPGHATHLHVRFYNPHAQLLASRAYPHLVDAGLIEKVTVYIHHRARRGDTLGALARRYHTSVKAIQRANGLRSTKIVAKRVYKIPRKGGPPPIEGKLAFPARLLPPPRVEKQAQK